MDFVKYCFNYAIDKYTYYGLTQTELDTQLLGAIYKKNLKKVTSLLNVGADINIRNWDDQTPLMIASRYEETGLLELLLSKNAVTLDAQDGKGQTALMKASLEYNAKTIKILLGAKPNLALRDNHGDSPLHMACGNISCGTELPTPSEQKLKDTLNLLIEAGFSVNEFNIHNKTPTMVALNRDSALALDILMKAGADLNLKGGLIQDQSSVYLAVWVYRGNSMRFLLNQLSEEQLTEQSKDLTLIPLGFIAGQKNKIIFDIRKKMFEIVWAVMRGSEQQELYHHDAWYSIISQEGAYPEWYRPQIQDDIKLILQKIVEIKKKLNEDKKPEPVVFSTQALTLNSDNTDKNLISKKSKFNEVNDDENEMKVEGVNKKGFK